MALGAEVIDLVRLDDLHQLFQPAAVSEIAVVQKEFQFPFVQVLVDVHDPPGIE